MPLMDLTFLTRNDILVLLKEGGTDAVTLGLFSVLERKVVIQCCLPFPDSPWMAYILNGPITFYGDNCPASRAKISRPDLRHRIVSLMYHHHLPQYSFCVVLQTGPFLNKCKELLNGSPEINVFDWLKWGPDVTRCIPLEFASPAGFRCTFGSYMLIIGNPNQAWIEGYPYRGHPQQGRFLMLLDFNPIPIRRCSENRTQNDQHDRYLIRAKSKFYTTLEHTDQYSISTSLPFRVFMRPWKPSCSNLHLDANTIVARLV
jgi:hypothetical protein